MWPLNRKPITAGSHLGGNSLGGGGSEKSPQTGPMAPRQNGNSGKEESHVGPLNEGGEPWGGFVLSEKSPNDHDNQEGASCRQVSALHRPRQRRLQRERRGEGGVEACGGSLVDMRKEGQRKGAWAGGSVPEKCRDVEMLRLADCRGPDPKPASIICH